MSRKVMRFTGVGGQGVLLAGEIFAAAKIKAGGFGLKTATYTSQVRGGPTVVDIQLDDNEIFYPYAKQGEINFMLSVAQVSFDSFKDGVVDGGIIVIEPNLITPTDEDRKRWNRHPHLSSTQRPFPPSRQKGTRKETQKPWRQGRCTRSCYFPLNHEQRHQSAEFPWQMPQE